MPSANAAYSFGPRAWLDDLTCYSNLSTTRSVGHSSGVRDSWQNVTGRNMWFAGGDGIGINNGGPSRWHSQLNLNIGFYF